LLFGGSLIAIPFSWETQNAIGASLSMPFPEGESHQVTKTPADHKYGPDVDFDLDTGDPITAVKSGVVEKVVDNNNRSCYDEIPNNGKRVNECENGELASKYNNVIAIDHGSTQSAYVHIKYDGALLEEGDRVLKGQQIAKGGSTGFSSGPHLHFSYADDKRAEPGDNKSAYVAGNIEPNFSEIDNLAYKYYTSQNTFDSESAKAELNPIYDDLNLESENKDKIINRIKQGDLSISHAREEVIENNKSELKDKLDGIGSDLSISVDKKEAWLNEMKKGDSLQQVRSEIIDTVSDKIRENIKKKYEEADLPEPSSETIDKQIEALKSHANLEDVRWAAKQGVTLFEDVPKSSEFGKYIYEMAANDTVSGYGDGIFDPNKKVSREELAKMVSKQFDLTLSKQEYKSSEKFPDVPLNNDFAKWIYSLNKKDVINGYGDGTFRPNNKVTRGEASKFTVNGASEAIQSDIQSSCSDNGSFKDVSPGNAFYEHIETLGCDKIIGGYPDGTFRPSNKVTRGEISKFLVNSFNEYVNPSQTGANQNSALQPTNIVNNWKTFFDVKSSLWYDPPTTHGFEFDAIGDTKFSDVLNFPSGIDANNQFALFAGGSYLGEYSPGDSVDFNSLLGKNISNFTITGIDPIEGNQTDFPIQLAFNNETGSFRMRALDDENTPKDVPEPSSALGLLVFGSFGIFFAAKRK
jgi:murein DD-endopeptidase MepM/ murein hydrolase activator NlpD